MHGLLGNHSQTREGSNPLHLARLHHVQRRQGGRCPCGSRELWVFVALGVTIFTLGTAVPSLGAGPATVANAGPPHQALVVGRCEGLSRAALGAILDLRLSGEVLLDPPDVAAAPANLWLLDVAAAGLDVEVVLRASDGRQWSRVVTLPAEADEAEGIRQVALAVEYLVALADAPFVAQGDAVPADATGDEAERGDGGTFPDAPPEVEVGGAEAGLAPAAMGTSARPGALRRGPAEMAQEAPVVPTQPGLENGPAAWSVVVELLAGAAGNLGGEVGGRSTAFVLGGRTGLEWHGGIWGYVAVGWHYVAVSSPLSATLELVPLRVGVGAVLSVEDWRIRLAFEALFEWWRAEGEARWSDWRAGGGLLFSWGRVFLSWLEGGIDLGADLTPGALELTYRDVPVLSASAWRWRAGAWLAVRWAW